MVGSSCSFQMFSQYLYGSGSLSWGSSQLRDEAHLVLIVKEEHVNIYCLFIKHAVRLSVRRQ